MLCPRDMIGLLRSNLGIFLLRNFGVVWVFILIYQECNLAAHSFAHASFIMRRGLTRFQRPKGFLGLRIAECRNSSDILEWGPGALQIGKITLIAPNHLLARIGYLQVPTAGNHRFFLQLIHLSSFHHHSLGPIHFKLLSCWVESTHPFAARDVDSRPSVLLHLSGGHNCLTRCWPQMICEECGNQTREHQSGYQSSYWLRKSVLNLSDLTRTYVTHKPPHASFLIKNDVYKITSWRRYLQCFYPMSPRGYPWLH